MNKRGMLANIIAGFIVILVGVTLIGTISQEVDNMLSCNSTNSTNMSVNVSYEPPIGTTDSFGGGGGQFGGYDGKVYKSWATNLAPIKTNQTITGICLGEQSTWAITMLKMLPAFFALAIIFMAVGIVYGAFRGTSSV